MHTPGSQHGVALACGLAPVAAIAVALAVPVVVRRTGEAATSVTPLRPAGS